MSNNLYSKSILKRITFLLRFKNSYIIIKDVEETAVM